MKKIFSTALAILVFIPCKSLALVVRSNFDLNGNGVAESSAVSSVNPFICAPCTLDLEVNNGIVLSGFDFDWNWAGLRYKSHVGPFKSRKHTWQTFMSVVQKNGTIDWDENPAVDPGIPDKQVFPAPAHVPVPLAILDIFGDLIGAVFGSPVSRLEFGSYIQQSGTGYHVQNTVKNNWNEPLYVEWIDAGVIGSVNPGSSLSSPVIYAERFMEALAPISVSGLADHGDGVSFTHIGPSTYWQPEPVPAPLPFLGIGAAFSYSRKLRYLSKQIKNAKK